MDPAMTTTNCLLRHRGDKPRRATTGLLCDAHAAGLYARIADIARMWQLLDDLVAPGQALTGGRAGIDPAAPCRLDIIAIRDPRTVLVRTADGRPLKDEDHSPIVPVLAEVVGWARIVVEERHVAMPAGLQAATALLLDHHDWTCAQPWVDELDQAMRACLAQLEHVLGAERPASVGTCTAPLEDGSDCGGPLRQDRWGLLAVECARCGDRWSTDDTQRELRRLGLVIG